MATKSALREVVEEVEREVKDDLSAWEGMLKEARQGILKAKARLVLAHRSAKVIEPLLKLKSDRAVEKFLRDRKVRGVAGSATHCAIAAYLNKNAPKGAAGRVDSRQISLDGISVPHSVATRLFIGRFDEGAIPDLIRKGKKK